MSARRKPPDERLWEGRRVRAGPLVKELRMIRPRLRPDDSGDERREKRMILARCALLRQSADRLELRLARFGWEGTHYVLTFSGETLPPSFARVQAEWRNFARRVRRWRKKTGRAPEFDYIRCIEGLHARYHIHFVCRASDFTEDDVRALWRRGDVLPPEPVLKDFRGYRRLAKYFLKERNDGVAIPLDKEHVTWSGSLDQLPGVECFSAPSGRIPVPRGALCAQRPGSYVSPFGSFAYASYLVPDRSRACARVRSHL